MRAAYSSPSPTQGVLWVAQMGGLFLRNGLSVEIIFTRAAIETLVAGEVEFGQMTGALMSSAKLQGADPVMIAGIQDQLDDRLVARPTIKSMEELKGKRIGIFRFGSASHLRVLNILPRYGLTERDVAFLQIGDNPARLIALLGGAIDATLLPPPDHLEALRGNMKLLLNLRELNVLLPGHRSGHHPAFAGQAPRSCAALHKVIRRGDPSGKNQSGSVETRFFQVPANQG